MPSGHNGSGQLLTRWETGVGSAHSDEVRRTDSDRPLDETSVVRDRIVEAASRCLAKDGLDRTFISGIAREAGVSRQTIYNHFTSKEQIVDAAIEHAATTASALMVAVAEYSSSAAEFAVELCMAALAEFPRNPAISPLIDVLEGSDARARVMQPEVIATARRDLEPLIGYVPELEPMMDEITETYLRFELSLLTMAGPHQRSDDELRGYLHRTLVPALGLPPHHAEASTVVVSAPA